LYFSVTATTESGGRKCFTSGVKITDHVDRLVNAIEILNASHDLQPDRRAAARTNGTDDDVLPVETLRFAARRSRCERNAHGGYRFHGPAALSTMTPEWDWIGRHAVHAGRRPATVIAFLIAYTSNRKLFPGAQLLGIVCMAPFVVPGIVLAIGFYAAYTSPPLVLYGTAWILILAFTTRFLPVAYSSVSASMRSINPEMEEAVRILGGGRGTPLYPLTKHRSEPAVP